MERVLGSSVGTGWDVSWLAGAGFMAISLILAFSLPSFKAIRTPASRLPRRALLRSAALPFGSRP
jgi:hypothetical protein